ncbi:A24 family peptidase C-terminal domain-containing protein [Geoglobus acetivorans]|uniref:Peptidase A24B, FlaK-like n=1 Tax=Geoglobus acetivorans TaxID=565033 RepID=A0A0A7GGH6_GEOAI|nr:Peptidase A24B, FlaK-like [Geoglobus acetivorans]
MEGITAIKFLTGLAILIYASRLDWKSRIIPNRVWKVFLAALLPFVFLELVLYPHLRFELYLAIFQAVFVILISYVFYCLGFYGGADAKALMVISVAFPFYPSFSVFPVLMKGFSFAFSTLANAVIFAPLFVVYFLIRNLLKEGARGFRKYPFYYFIGKRVDAESIPEHHALLEFVNDKGEFTRVKRGVEPDSAMIKALKKAKREGKVEKVWVTPQIPFIIFITVGYVIAFFLGDVLTYLITRLL